MNIKELLRILMQHSVKIEVIVDSDETGEVEIKIRYNKLGK